MIATDVDLLCIEAICGGISRTSRFAILAIKVLTFGHDNLRSGSRDPEGNFFIFTAFVHELF